MPRPCRSGRVAMPEMPASPSSSTTHTPATGAPSSRHRYTLSAGSARRSRVTTRPYSPAGRPKAASLTARKSLRSPSVRTRSMVNAAGSSAGRTPASAAEPPPGGAVSGASVPRVISGIGSKGSSPISRASGSSLCCTGSLMQT